MQFRKNSIFVLGLAVFIGIVVSIAFVSILNVVANAHATQQAEHIERELKAQAYHNCIREAYPTLTYGLFGGYIDTRTGQRFNVVGTEQDKKCQARIYNR